MQLIPSKKQAINQVMSVLTKEQQKEFERWLNTNENPSSSTENILFGHPYYLIYLNSNLYQYRTELQRIPAKQEKIINYLRSVHDFRQTVYYVDSFLVFALNQQRRGSELTLIMLSEKTLSGLLHSNYAPEHFTPSEVRVLAQLISDPEIKHAATADNVQPSTKETHYKSAARKIGGRKRIGVIANLTAQLLMEITVASLPHEPSHNKVFNEYRERYLPSEIKVLMLSTPEGKPHRILDMGPRSGEVIIVLHPMILPDIRDQDIRLLHKLNLRLVWPLRHGSMEPDVNTLSVHEQLEHGIEGIELVRQYFCDRPFILAALITSAWYSIRYAERYPHNISALLFAGACCQRNKKSSRSRQFGEGLITLAAQHHRTIDLVLKFAKKHFSRHERFHSLLQSIFSESVSDLEIIQQEMSRPGFEGRYYFALSKSFHSLKHDLLHQTDMGWEKLRPLDIPAHFVHGEDDVIDTIEDIEALIEKIPKATLKTLPNCGQLMYYQHFEEIARFITLLNTRITR